MGVQLTEKGGELQGRQGYQICMTESRWGAGGQETREMLKAKMRMKTSRVP